MLVIKNNFGQSLGMVEDAATTFVSAEQLFTSFVISHGMSFAKDITSAHTTFLFLFHAAAVEPEQLRGNFCRSDQTETTLI